MFTLDSSLPIPLVTQIVEGFRRMIEDGQLRAGAKLPSIRQFAHSHEVSVYTVVDAYDRLVALGFFASRPHSGKGRRAAPRPCAAHGRTRAAETGASTGKCTESSCRP